MKALASNAVVCLAVTVWAPTFAAADVLYLKNGDRITGTIKSIWDDEVTIEPEYSDEFQVDLPIVERIESDRDFEIEMPCGKARDGHGRDTRHALAHRDRRTLCGSRCLEMQQSKLFGHQITDGPAGT